jgi:hypothetical protein
MRDNTLNLRIREVQREKKDCEPAVSGDGRYVVTRIGEGQSSVSVFLFLLGFYEEN